MKTILGQLNGEFLLNLTTRAAKYASRVSAAVAYAEPNHPFFNACRAKGLHVTFYGLLDERGAVAPALLADLLSLGPSQVDCRLLKGHFHPKVIWWHGFGAYIGSANLTHAAWFKNIECGMFIEEDELEANGVAGALDTMFAHLHANSVALTRELVEKLQSLEVDRRALQAAQAKLRKLFDSQLSMIPDNPALTVSPEKGHRPPTARNAFVREWSETLQLLRGLAADFEKLKLRPKWVKPTAHPVVHFDQFLHAYYYDFVRGGRADADEDDEDESTADKVERGYERNRVNPRAALSEGAKWWASLRSDPYGEGEFIKTTAPAMVEKFSRRKLQEMTAPSFLDAMKDVNAFRMHARQMKNAFYGLPAHHKEKLDRRVARLAQSLWDARSASGRTVRDLLTFVIWGSDPSDMVERLWLATKDDAHALPHFGPSAIGETVGWARPDDFPPRNNRTNKALRSLGHNVRLFYKG